MNKQNSRKRRDQKNADAPLASPPVSPSEARIAAQDVFERFLERPDCGLSAITRKTYSRHVGMFVRWLFFNDLKLDEVRKKHLEAFQKELNEEGTEEDLFWRNQNEAYSDASQNSIATAIMQFFSLCNRKGLTTFHPHLQRITLDAPQVEYLYFRELKFFNTYLRCFSGNTKRAALRTGAAALGIPDSPAIIPSISVPEIPIYGLQICAIL